MVRFPLPWVFHPPFLLSDRLVQKLCPENDFRNIEGIFWAKQSPRQMGIF